MSVASAFDTAAIPTIAIPAPQTGPAALSLPGVAADRLGDAFAACRGIAKARARNFYYGLRLTPEPRRSAVYSIYAWMRAADDEADAGGSPASRRERLAAYRALTERVLEDPTGAAAGQVASETGAPCWLAWAATLVGYQVDPGLFRAMLDGLDEDLAHPEAGYATEGELWRYCYRVASTVGLACVSVWGLRPGADPEAARDLAIKRGQAFQRTNILRDFAQDFDESPRRVYLPREAFEAAGVTAGEVRAWAKPGPCGAFLAGQAAIARRYYDESAGLEDLVDPACVPTLWAMTRIYAGLLELIEREPARVVSGRRIRLSSSKKAAIALSATLRARLGR